jgi:hypothetical protein
VFLKGVKLMAAYSPEPWEFDPFMKRVIDSNGASVCHLLRGHEATDIDGILIANAIPMLDVIRELVDAAYTIESSASLDNAREKAEALLRKLE